MLKAHNALGWIETRLGYLPEDAQAAMGVLNAAGEALVSPPGGHTWRWLNREALLDLTIAQNYIDLPSDFQSMLDLGFAEDFVSCIHTTTMPQLIELERLPQSGLSYHVALVYEVVGAEPVPRLRVTPEPTATEADVLKLYYRAGWTELAEPSDDIVIPHWIVDLYRELVVAYALGWQEADEFPLAAQLAGVWTSDLALSKFDRDGGIQRVYGPPSNTIIPHRGPGNPTPYWNGTVQLT